MIPAPVIHATPAALGIAVAAEIAQAFRAAGGRPFLLGCPGGRSPTPVYAALAEELKGADLSSLVIVMMDDYLDWVEGRAAHVPGDAHYSCRRFAHQDIQAVLNKGHAPGQSIPGGHVWFPDPADPSAYDRRLREAGGIDYFILASGASDGHVAFNPPGSPVSSQSRIVLLAEKTRRDNLATFPEFPSIDAVPTHGVTVGIATIAGLSRAGALVLWGVDKRLAFDRLAAAKGYEADWPATVFRLIPGARLHADRAAAGAER